MSTANVGCTITDGPNWSPDGGYFWKRDGKLFWEDGEITDVPQDQVIGFRLMPGHVHCEDFSQWTDEHRAEVKEAFRLRRETNRKMMALVEENRQRLVLSAKRKLTKAEFKAVLEEGRD